MGILQICQPSCLQKHTLYNQLSKIIKIYKEKSTAKKKYIGHVLTYHESFLVGEQQKVAGDQEKKGTRGSESRSEDA